QRGDRRAAGEDRQADDEQPLPAEPIAEGGASQEEDGEGQRVGVDDPLELGQVGSEARPDDREGGRDDEVVERGHEQGDRADREGPGDAHGAGHGVRSPYLLVVTKYSAEKRGGRGSPSSGGALLEHLEGPARGLTGQPDGRAAGESHHWAGERLALSPGIG